MNAVPVHPSLQFSALQIAWLQELGIDKPWIPGDVPRNQPVAVPPVKIQLPASTVPHLAGRTPVGHRPPSPAAPLAPTKKEALAVSALTGSEVRTADIAAMTTDLAGLTAAIAACQACGLCQERHQVVVGQGVERPTVMVIGEAPGEQEDRQGQPFVGRSGRLLDNMLSAIGSGRDRNVYVANAIKCRPPGNRNPRPDELAACLPFLQRQIELVRPDSILALGRFAAQALLSTEGTLLSLRGQSHFITSGGRQIPVVVSYHPAYLLRRPMEKAAAWQDLQAVRNL